MRALQVRRSAPRFGLARMAAAISAESAARLGPLEHRRLDEPERPGPGWVRLRPRLSGICGSDLAMLEGRASTYFDPIVSFPFTPGHEIVADVLDGELAGRRVVVIPVLHCVARGIDPPCPACLAGAINRCERIAFGRLDAGLQTGFCTATGGGWGELLVAHESQLVPVPEALSDEAAVMIEPTACAVRAARQAGDAALVVVLGAGTLGLLTIAALGEAARGRRPERLIATARYPLQRRWAEELGAEVCAPDEVARRVRSITGSLVIGEQLTAGSPVVVDCVGSDDSIRQALDVVAPGGEIVLVGMPGHTSVDLTGLWHREVALRGCYAYERDDFDAAVGLVGRLDLGRLVSATYPIRDHVDALAHAAGAGPRGAVRIAFDLRAPDGAP